jgi:hypothetical protein
MKLILILFILLISGCSHIDSNKVINEVQRLQVLSNTQNLTISDLNLLLEYSNDPKITDEFDELKWMIEHGFQNHAYHSLQSIYDIEIGNRLICPFDPLSHVAIYLQYNETKKAIDSAKDGASQMSSWKNITFPMHQKNSSYYPGLEELIIAMENEITYMNEGKYDSALTESRYVSENGYC